VIFILWRDIVDKRKKVLNVVPLGLLFDGQFLCGLLFLRINYQSLPGPFRWKGFAIAFHSKALPLAKEIKRLSQALFDGLFDREVGRGRHRVELL
jgi:hypothetical protein